MMTMVMVMMMMMMMMMMMVMMMTMIDDVCGDLSFFLQVLPLPKVTR